MLGKDGCARQCEEDYCCGCTPEDEEGPAPTVQEGVACPGHVEGYYYDYGLDGGRIVVCMC